MSAGQLEAGIVAKIIKVVGVFVAAGNGKHPDPQDVGHAVGDKPGIAPVGDQGCEGAGEPDTALDGTEKHDATVRGHASAIKRGADFLAPNRWKTEGQQSILQHSGCGSRDNVDGMVSTPTL